MFRSRIEQLWQIRKTRHSSSRFTSMPTQLRVHQVSRRIFLDTTDDKYSLRLAATENKTSQERVSEIQLAMVGLSMRYHTEESEALANEVQDAMTDVAHRYRQGGVRDLGVKSSLFYVLLGARMPAILAEVGFITNPLDAELLNQRWYRRKLAASMAQKIGKVISSNASHKGLKN